MSKWKIFFKSLKVQITSYYLMVSILMLVIISGVYYYSTSSIILDDTLNQTIYAVEQSSTDLENYLVGLKETAVYLSQNDAIREFLLHDNRQAAYDVIGQALATENSIVTIVVVGKEGKVLSNETELGMSVSDDMMKENWYVSAINNQQMPALTSARLQEFTMDKDTWVIAFSQEVVDDNGENLGVVLIDIKYQVIEGYLDHLPLGDKGFAFIMDDMKHVVYHPDPSYFTEEDKTNDLISMVVGKEGYDEKDKLLTHHVEIENTHWTLVGVSSLDRLDIVRRQIIEVLIVLGLIILSFVIGGSYIIANRITQPIKRLQDAMADMEHIDWSKSTGAYEVDQLSHQYKTMLDEIERLLSEIKDNERYLRQYEISALYSQINPHFLYNTLDTIVWMAEFNDSEKVIEVTKSLAQFFRISLSKGQEMISLESEIDHISHYLFIQKQRYDDQLRYTIHLEDELKSIQVPKIILQPIVENAIYHGIKEKGEGGLIEVNCQSVEGKLIITIEDNGVGFDHNKSSKVKLGGVGLENVKRRLALIYKNTANVTVESSQGIGTKVSINIPIK